MRIGLVIYGSLDIVSGGYLYDRKLVEHLRRQGDEIEIVSQPWGSYLGRLRQNLSAGLLERLAASQFDVLLQDELNHLSLFQINARLRRRVRYPIISIVHHLLSSEARPDWQNRLYRLVEARYLRSVDGFIFNSRTTRQAVYDAAGGVSRSRPHVVAYPAGGVIEAQISAGEIEQRARQPGPLRAVFVGNWIARKGLHTLLEALSRLPAGACRLHVVGEMQTDPAYTRRIRRQLDRLELAGRVELCGRLSAEALAQTLRQAQVMVVPSSYEGFGIVYLEGMAFGLPAIATTAGAAAEIITPGGNGLLVAPDDAGELAGQLMRLASDREMLARMGQAARQRFLEHPTWEDSAAAIRAFLIAFRHKSEEERRV